MAERNPGRSIAKGDCTRVSDDDAKIRDRVFFSYFKPDIIGTRIGIARKHYALAITIGFIDPSIGHGHTIMHSEVNILRPSMPGRLCLYISDLLFLVSCRESTRLSKCDDLRSDDEDIAIFEGRDMLFDECKEIFSFEKYASLYRCDDHVREKIERIKYEIGV